MKLSFEVSDKTYDKLLSRAYEEESTVAELISDIVETWGSLQPEVEMSTLELELEDGVLEILRQQAEDNGLTIDEVVIRALVEQMGNEEN